MVGLAVAADVGLNWCVDGVVVRCDAVAPDADSDDLTKSLASPKTRRWRRRRKISKRPR